MVDKNKRFWKIKTGFRKSEFISVEEGGDLEKAIFAFRNETPTEIGGNFIRGKNILGISPDFNKHTGWNYDYEPTSADDKAQIKRDCPDYTGVLEKYKQKVEHLIEIGRTDLIGKNKDINLLN